MDKKKRIILISQSVLCILLVVLLCTAAISIYTAGKAENAADPNAWIYTREKVGQALLYRLPVFILAVGVTIAAAVMGVRNESSPYKDNEITRDLMAEKIKEPTDAMKAERKKQMIIHISGWVIFGLCMIPILLYITNGNHFDKSDAIGLESVMGALVKSILPWTVIALGVLSVSFILRDKSIIKETELIKSAEKSKDVPQPAVKSTVIQNVIRGIVFLTSVAFIIIGTQNGSMTDVHYKAIRICTECIGLG